MFPIVQENREKEKENKTYRLLIKSARQVVQVAGNREKFLTSSFQNNVSILEAIEGEDGYSLAIDQSGNVEKILVDSEMKKWSEGKIFEKVINAYGKAIIPGFVDAHTHALWAGDRVHEFSMKLAGASYLDVHKAGGGIHFTVRHVAQATKDELFEGLKANLIKILHSGTTTVEVKTGYGLEWKHELKMLKVIERAIRDPDLPLDIVVTYCAAHAVPINKTSEEATLDIINNQIPELKKMMDLGEIRVDNIDVFCENGVFSTEQTKRILKAGMDIGLKANFHAEELNRLHSAEMGVELKATAMSHLEEVSEEAIQSMSRSKISAVLLPTTAHILRLRPPPARRMIEAGVPVALGSDFNPNAHCFAMPIIMHLACIQLRLSMEEALVASTINSAYSLNRSSSIGSIEEEKKADIIILDVPKWEHIIYQLGSYHHLIDTILKSGLVVYSKHN